MKTASFAYSLVLAATLLGGTAIAQTTAPGGAPRPPVPGATGNAPMPGVSNNTGVTPNTGVVDRNSGTAAASGDRNQGVSTTSANAPQPARGRNSFSEGEARRRIERNGYQNVTGLKKDNGGVWRGTGMKDSQSEEVWLDYKGNVGPHPTPASNRAAGNTSATGVTRPLGNPTGTLGTGGTVGGPVGSGTTGNVGGSSTGRTP